MKKITKFLLVLVAIATSFSYAKAVESTFCQTTVTHFNIPAETASGIKLTISKIDATSMYVEIESATSDPVDLLLVNGGSGATISDATVSGVGKLKRTLTWTTAPANVNIQLLWSKETMGGNWMLDTFSVPFDATCPSGPVEPDTEIPTAFTATLGAVTATSAELLLNATDNSGSVTYTISYGTNNLTTTGTSGTQKSYIVTGLTQATAYTFSVSAKDAANNAAANNPISIEATTNAIPAAPNPSHTNVISVYSGSFTNQPTVLQNWYGNTFSTETFSGNEAMKNNSICCFGYEFNAKPINVSTMNKLHVDIYPVSLASMSLGITDGADRMKTGIALTPNQWNSIDLTLSELTGANLANVNQVGFWNLNGSFYFDNLYFYNDVSTSVTTVENSIKLYPNPASGSITITAQSEINAIRITNLVGQTIKNMSVNAVERVIDLNDMNNGQYIISLSMKNGEIINKKFSKK